MKQSQVQAVAVAAGVVVAGYCVWHATTKAGGPPIPAFAEDVNNLTPAHLATASELHQVAYARHRYPSWTGSEISGIIANGWVMARIPAVGGSEWMTNPPSEEPLLS